jgi:AAA domain (dynein-related subfamily)
MKPSLIKEALSFCIDTQTPAFLWGPSGIGKSEVVEQTAAAHDIALLDVRLSLWDPTDLKGFPVVKGKTVSWVPPDALPTAGKGILFLDELNLAKHATQAAAYQLILDRKLGNYTLPDGWTVVAAGNRSEDRANVHAMPAPLANRFRHFFVEADVDEWCLWAAQNGVSDVTRAFIQFRPGLLHLFDPKSVHPAFPTPRSWRFVDGVMENSFSDAALRMAMIEAAVGPGAAMEYIGFVDQIKDLPSVQEILLNPDGAALPASPAARYACVTALDRLTTVNNIGRLTKYVTRMNVEFQALYMQSVCRLNRELTRTAEVTTWCTTNKDVLL